MKLHGLGLVAAVSLASGCVSQSRFEELQAHDRDTAWRLEAAEKSTLKVQAEKTVVQRELDLAREEARIAREKVALANDAMKDARKDTDEELKARLAELQSKAPTKQELSPYGGVVLESGILFAPGRHELTKDGETALGPIVESLTSPKYDGFTVELSGHTDADPLRATAKVYMDNHDLAAKRANSVRRFLIAKGVPADRVYLSAWGETRPLASEATKEDKARNRRVEIRLHHTGGTVELTGSAKPGTETTRPASSAKDEGCREEAKDAKEDMPAVEADDE